MTIKTYPLQFTEKELEEIRECAKSKGMTVKAFMLEAIKEKKEK